MWLCPGPSLTSKEEILSCLCLRERYGRAHHGIVTFSLSNPWAGGAKWPEEWPAIGCRENAAACTDLGHFAQGRKQFLYLSFILYFLKGFEEAYNIWISRIKLSKIKLTNQKLCRKKRIHQPLDQGILKFIGVQVPGDPYKHGKIPAKEKMIWFFAKL